MLQALSRENRLSVEASGWPDELGSRCRVATTARNPGEAPIVDKQVELRLAGVRDDVLATGLAVLRGEAEFEVTMPDDEVCYRLVAADRVASDRVCVLPA